MLKKWKIFFYLGFHILFVKNCCDIISCKQMKGFESTGPFFGSKFQGHTIACLLLVSFVKVSASNEGRAAGACLFDTYVGVF